MSESEAFKLALDALWKIGSAQSWSSDRRRLEAQSVLSRLQSVAPTHDAGVMSLASATTAGYRQATRLGWQSDEASGIA